MSVNVAAEHARIDRLILKSLTLLAELHIGHSELQDDKDGLLLCVSDPKRNGAIIPPTVKGYWNSTVSKGHPFWQGSDEELADGLNRLAIQGYLKLIPESNATNGISPGTFEQSKIQLLKPFWDFEAKNFIRTWNGFRAWIAPLIVQIRTSASLRDSIDATSGSAALEIIKEAGFHADRLGLLEGDQWEQNEDWPKDTIRNQVKYLRWLDGLAKEESSRQSVLMSNAEEVNGSMPITQDQGHKRPGHPADLQNAHQAVADINMTQQVMQKPKLTNAPEEALKAYFLALSIGKLDGSLSIHSTDEEVYKWLNDHHDDDRVREFAPLSLAAFKKSLTRGRHARGIKKRLRAAPTGKSVVRAKDV
ncbi:hypothetical protein [Zavarzinella formosa]|uniref:hypothetical protein n=1 Tax=Zavarzinella formosa TaxID=360055 RepID=UPI0002F21677|nr:hypothetical protein [Zavarzinella formosa]